MNMFSFRLVVAAFLCYSWAFSQEVELVLLNGKTMKGVLTDTTGQKISLQNKKKPEKPVIIENDRVFSIIYPDKKEVIVYRQDSAGGDEFTVEDMRLYIEGQRDAINNFKAKGAFWGGVGTGALGAFVFSPIPMLSPLIPGAFTGINGARFVKFSKMKGADPAKLEKDTYVMGYSRAARNIRIQSALKGAGIGLVAGLAVFIGFDNEIPDFIEMVR